METRIYNLQCARPRRATLNLLLEHARRANAYLNKLIEGERKRRTEFRVARSKLFPELEQLEATQAELQERITIARDELQRAKGESRGKAQLTAAKAAVSELIAERKALNERVREARAVIASEMRVADRELEIRCSKVPDIVRVRHAVEDKLEACKAVPSKEQDKAAIGRLTEQIKQLRADKSRLDYGPRIKERVNAKELDGMLRESRWPEMWRIARRLQAEQLEAHKAARAESRLSPGTYLLVDEQFERMRKSAADPEFSSFARRDRARVGVQVRNVPIAQFVNGTSKRIRLVQDDRSDSSNAKARTVEMSAGDSVARLPVWISRDFPEDALIKQAWVLLNRNGPMWKTDVRCDVQLTIASSQFPRTRRRGVGTVAINLGWRVKDDGSVRVAYAVDDSGHGWEIALPAKTRQRMRKKAPLLGFADDHFNAARDYLLEWRKLHPTALPDWCEAEIEHLAQWRSRNRLDAFTCKLLEHMYPDGQDRVRALWQMWKRERLKGPDNHRKRTKGVADDLFAPPNVILRWVAGQGVIDPLEQLVLYLDFWRRKNLHLCQYAAGAYRHATLSRREHYRQIARDLASGYDRLVIESFDLRKVAKDQPPESSTDEITAAATAARRVRVEAAPGVFREILLSAFEAKVVRGAVVGERVDAYEATNITRRHNLCGHINEQSHAEHIEVFCENPDCPQHGMRYDQDRNACLNLLAMDRERRGGDGNPGSARKRIVEQGSAVEADAS